MRSPHRIFAALFAIALTAAVSADEATNPTRWEKAIAAFEAEQAAHPAAPDSILFVGSSSIRLWDLKASWPGEALVNHGFGGSLLADTVHFFDRIVAPIRPRAIVVYAGDNDIAKGRDAAAVASSFQALVEKRDRALPGVPLIYIPIKPSIKRWELWPEMKKANDRIAALCVAGDALYLADTAAVMLKGTEGAPAPEWFAADGLHLSPKGYQSWTETVSAALKKAGALP